MFRQSFPLNRIMKMNRRELREYIANSAIAESSGSDGSGPLSTDFMRKCGFWVTTLQTLFTSTQVLKEIAIMLADEELYRFICRYELPLEIGVRLREANGIEKFTNTLEEVLGKD